MKNIDYFEILKDFLKKAGKLALNNRNQLTTSSKYDDSIVTETDLKISNMFQKIIKKNFPTHCIIDEEKSLKDKKYLEKVKKSEYVWIIDPIDGTKPYFHGSNLFAIALSLYKNSKPVFGVIYLPATAQLIYNDNNQVYQLIDAFTRREIKVDLSFQEKEINKSSLVHFPVKHASKYIKDYKFSFIDGYSSYIYAYDVLTNIAHGAYYKNNISMWDLYSAFPIAKKLGIKIYNIEDGSELEELDFSLFKDDLKAKNIWLICHPKYKNEILSIL